MHSLNLTGLSTIKSMPVNVTSSDKLRMGVRFTAPRAQWILYGYVTQLDHKWYQFCWVHLLHPFQCKPNRYEMAVGLIVRKQKSWLS
ncbi:unnamed protein product [Peronospora destructor]|uniref:Uncharacterized protein n=1 Tax=Peronospora destructor TaxID=86335 RepID=A0AAV0TEV2_9STRA|nr:unnamed protein product [Peronospora destructor]